MGRNVAIAGVLLALTVAVRGDDGPARPADVKAINEDFLRWIYPGARLLHQASFVTENDRVVGIAPASGEYSTEAPFHEVVRFYVDRSGFEPPNWSILGREFPGDRINIPGFWMAQMGVGKTVTIQHHIRRDSATLTLLMSDEGGRRVTAVALARDAQDARTYIQITRHVPG